MTSDNVVKAHFPSLLIKDIELKILVASDAGIRCLPSLIAAYKGFNNVLSKLCFIMKDLVINP